MISSEVPSSQVDPAATVEVESLMNGTISVRADQIVRFVQPVIGFEDLDRYVFIQTDQGPMYWLQSVDKTDAAFCLLAPFQAGLDPDMPITRQDMADIGAESPEDIVVYTILVLDRDPNQIRTNLRAPILYSKVTNLAKQTVIDNTDLPVQFFLKDLLPRQSA